MARENNEKYVNRANTLSKEIKTHHPGDKSKGRVPIAPTGKKVIGAPYPSKKSGK